MQPWHLNVNWREHDHYHELAGLLTIANSRQAYEQLCQGMLP